MVLPALMYAASGALVLVATVRTALVLAAAERAARLYARHEAAGIELPRMGAWRPREVEL